MTKLKPTDIATTFDLGTSSLADPMEGSPASV